MEPQVNDGNGKNVAVVNTDLITSLVLNGDISKMNEVQKVQYYDSLCRSLNLNPATQPFQIIKFQGKEKLYATKDCTEQLRKLNGVSVIDMTTRIEKDIMITIVKVQDKSGRIDLSTGAVNIKGLSGDALANATMKSETKAKRRATLSICGLGMLDEAELDTMPKFETKSITDKVKNEFNGTDITEQENIDKLTALPENTKEGLRIVTDKNSKKAIEICIANDWDVVKIDAYIKSKLDK